MKKEKRGRTKEWRQLRGWFLTCKLALFLPSLAIGMPIERKDEGRKILYK
jgi:hypothetical protein